MVPPQFGFLGLKDNDAVNSRHMLPRGGVSRPLSKTMCIACEFHTRGDPCRRHVRLPPQRHRNRAAQAALAVDIETNYRC